MEDLKTQSLTSASHLINKEANLPNTTELAVVETDAGEKVSQSNGDKITPPSLNLAVPAGGMKPASAVIPSKQPASVLPTAKTATQVGAVNNVAKPTLAAAVNQASGVGLTIPKGLTGFNTSESAADQYDYFHGMIYAETSARKTTSAANMYGPENTLIILCRQPEQLIPLRGQGYKVLHANDDESLVFALTYPEVAAEKLLKWPEWKTLRDRTLVFDDVTEGINLLMERHSVNDEGKERKDARQIYKFAGAELKELFQSLRRKKLHLILISLAKVSNNQISNEERIAPHMPPSMIDFVTTDLEFVFYIDKSKWKFVTTSVYRSYVGEDDKGKPKVFKREIFAKNKIPMKFLDRRVFPATNEVNMDMRQIWESVKSGTPIEPSQGAK